MIDQIKALRPECVIDFQRDCILRDDGGGIKVAQWNAQLGPLPENFDLHPSFVLIDVPLALKKVKGLREAIAEGEAFIAQHGFDANARDKITFAAAAGMLTEEQLEKAKAVFTWIIGLQMDIERDPSNFKPDGSPPFKMQEILNMEPKQ